MMLNLLRKLRRDEKGPTAVETGLVAAAMAICGTVAVDTIGSRLSSDVQAQADKPLDGQSIAAR